MSCHSKHKRERGGNRRRAGQVVQRHKRLTPTWAVAALTLCAIGLDIGYATWALMHFHRYRYVDISIGMVGLALILTVCAVSEIRSWWLNRRKDGGE